MADDEYGDGGYFFGDDDYLYVEDEYAIADELAENQIPSPGYGGTACEIDNGEDYDIYEYFGELEYGEDSYWDSTIRHLGKDGTSKTEFKQNAGGAKRKRVGSATTERKGLKKRKTAPQTSNEGMENVIYKRFEARLPPIPPRSERRANFALLPDWEERFRDVKDSQPAEKSMPVEMQQAAEGVAEEKFANEEQGHEGEWEDDQDDSDPLAGLDPAALKAIMKQKLFEETGLELDGDMLDKMIAQMLSGSADDAAGSIADMMLGQAGEIEDSQASKWLAGKGVQLDGQGEAEDPDEPIQSSQSNSVAGLITTSPSGAVKATGTEHGMKPSASKSRKRKTPSDSDNQLDRDATDEKRPQTRRKSGASGVPSSVGKRKK